MKQLDISLTDKPAWQHGAPPSLKELCNPFLFSSIGKNRIAPGNMKNLVRSGRRTSLEIQVNVKYNIIVPLGNECAIIPGNGINGITKPVEDPYRFGTFPGIGMTSETFIIVTVQQRLRNITYQSIAFRILAGRVIIQDPATFHPPG
jgi:hypothetical protein